MEIAEGKDDCVSASKNKSDIERLHYLKRFGSQVLGPFAVDCKGING